MMDKKKNTLRTLTLLVVLSACTVQEERENWIWDAQILNPRLITGNGMIPDTLTPNNRIKAKLFRDFKTFEDSSGNDLIKAFNGYFFEIAIDTSRRPGIEYPYKKMNKFLKLVGDTAYIEIPTDSLLKYEGETLKWRTGYRITFTHNSDTTYMVGGRWHLDRNAR